MRRMGRMIRLHPRVSICGIAALGSFDGLAFVIAAMFRGQDLNRPMNQSGVVTYGDGEYFLLNTGMVLLTLTIIFGMLALAQSIRRPTDSAS